MFTTENSYQYKVVCENENKTKQKQNKKHKRVRVSKKEKTDRKSSLQNNTTTIRVVYIERLRHRDGICCSQDVYAPASSHASHSWNIHHKNCYIYIQTGLGLIVSDISASSIYRPPRRDTSERCMLYPIRTARTSSSPISDDAWS